MASALYGLVVVIRGGTWLAIKYQVEGGPLTASICCRMAANKRSQATIELEAQAS